MSKLPIKKKGGGGTGPFLVILALTLSACIGNAPAPTSNACANPISAIIHPSRLDTPETLRAIDVHNRSARALCPDGR